MLDLARLVERHGDGPDPGVPAWLLVGGPEEGLEALRRLLAAQGLQAVHLRDPAEARAALGNLELRAALVDLTRPERLEESLEVLDLLARRSPRVPVLARVRPDATMERWEASRRGADALVEPDATAAALLEAVESARDRSRTAAPRRVLAVDGDAAFLGLVRERLEPEGIRVDTLEDPTEFWARLESGRPDLAVLGLEMEGLSGLTLCRLVRQDLRWSGLPVLLVTGDTSAGSLDHVFASGADDYVTRSLAGQELAPRVRARLGRPAAPARPGLHGLLELASRAEVPVTLAAVRGPAEAVGRLQDHLEAPVPVSPLEWLVPFFGRSEDATAHLLGASELPHALVEFPRDGRTVEELTRLARHRLLEREMGGSPARALDILVVDDDEALAGLLVQALRDRGWRVRSVGTGEAALALLQGPGRPRLVILDVELPGISGFEVLRHLDRRGPRVLMVSRRSTPPEQVAALREGVWWSCWPPWWRPWACWSWPWASPGEPWTCSLRPCSSWWPTATPWC